MQSILAKIIEVKETSNQEEILELLQSNQWIAICAYIKDGSLVLSLGRIDDNYHNISNSG